MKNNQIRLVGLILVGILFGWHVATGSAQSFSNPVIYAIDSGTSPYIVWTYSNTSYLEFRVERSLDGATDWAEIATVKRTTYSQTNFQFNDPNNLCGTSYFYRIRAYYSLNPAYSGYSNTINLASIDCASTLGTQICTFTPFLNLSDEDILSPTSSSKLSGDGSRAFVLVNEELRIYDSSANLIGTVSAVTDYAVSENGQRIVFSSDLNLTGANPGSKLQVFLWDNGVISQLSNNVYGGIFGVSISRSGNELAFFLHNYETGLTQLYLWRSGIGLSHILPEVNHTLMLQISGNGQTLVFSDRGNYTGDNPFGRVMLYRWDALSGIEILGDSPITIDVHPIHRGDIFLDDDASNVSLDYISPTVSRQLAIWNAAEGLVNFPALDFTDSGNLGGFSADGNRLVFSHNVDFTGENQDENTEYFFRDGGTFRQITSTLPSGHEQSQLVSVSSDGTKVLVYTPLPQPTTPTDYAQQVHQLVLGICSAPVVTISPLNAPTSLSASSAGANSASLSWIDSNSDETAYHLERSSDGGHSWEEIESLNPDSTSYNDNNLACGKNFQYRLRASRNGYYSAYSNTAAFLSAACPQPLPISHLTATEITHNSVTLLWIDNAWDEDSVRIERSVDNGSTWTEIDVLPANSTSYLNESLACKTDYSYRLRVYRASDNRYSTYSDVLSLTSLICPLASPTNLTVTATTYNSISVSWTDNASDESGYRVIYERSVTESSGDNTVQANITSNTISNLSCNTNYAIQVLTLRSIGDTAPSEWISATTAACPATLAAPSNLVASHSSFPNALLAWTDNSNNDSDFIIYYSTNGGSSWTTVLASPNTTSKTLTLSCGQELLIRMRAYSYNGQYFSDYSETINYTAQSCTPFATPTGLFAYGISYSAVSLKWTDNATGEHGYKLEQSLDGGTTWTDKGHAISSYVFNLSSLDCSTTYKYRVYAYQDFSNKVSDYSNVVTVTTLSCLTPPLAPTNLSVSNVSAFSISLAWQDNANDEYWYFVERSTLPSSSFTVVASLLANNVAWTDSTVFCNQTYYYRVRMMRTADAQYSNYSNIVEQHSAACPPAPQAPSDLVLITKTSSSVTLAWTDNSSDETYFYLEESLDGSNWSSSSLAANSGNSTRIGLICTNTYYYRLYAYRGQSTDNSTSGYSNVVAVALVCPPATPTILNSTGASLTTIDLTWVDNAIDESDYILERSADSGTSWTNINLPANSSSYTDTGLSCGKSYYYRVRAYRASDGYSSNYSSTRIVITTICPLLAPTSLLVSASTLSSVTMQWNDPNSNETNYRVEKSTNGGVSWSQVTQLGANATSYTAPSTCSSQLVHYRVYAYRANPVATTDYSPVLLTAAQPCTPSSLTTVAAQTTQTTIGLQWSDSATNETSYILEFSKMQGGIWGSWIEIPNLPANTTSYLITNLNCQTQYRFRLRAYRADDNAYSAYASTTPSRTTTACPPLAPSNLSTSTIGGISLSWTDNATDETNYRLERSSNGGSSWTEIQTVTGTSGIDLTALCATSYSYRVRAYRSSDGQYSSYSNVVTVPFDCATALTDPVCSKSPYFTHVDNSWFYDLISGDGNFLISPTETTLYRYNGSTIENLHIDSEGASINYDGSKIAFLSYGDLVGGNPYGATQLYLWNNGSIQQLSHFEDNYFATSYFIAYHRPVIDDDGSRIVFSTSRDIETGIEAPTETVYIYLWDAVTGFQKIATVMDHFVVYYGYTISGDGSTVAYRRNVDGEVAIWRDTTGYQYLEAPSNFRDYLIPLISTPYPMILLDEDGSHLVSMAVTTEGKTTAYFWNILSEQYQDLGLFGEIMGIHGMSNDARRIMLSGKINPTGENSDLSWELFFYDDGDFRQLTTNLNSTIVLGQLMADDGLTAIAPMYYPEASNPANHASGTVQTIVFSCEPLPLDTPTGLAVASTNATSLDLSWNDDVYGETNYLLERSGDNGASWTEIAQPAVNSSSYSDTGLTCNTSYQYRLRAYRAGDNSYSSYSNVATGATSLCPPPTDPTNLSVTGTTETSVSLSWTDNSDESRFDLERSVDNGSTWSDVAFLDANITTHNDTTVLCGSSYQYRLRAYRSGDDQYSAYSNVVTGTSSLCPAPAAPAGLNVVSVGQTNITLGWTDNSDETGFSLERSVDSGTTWSEIAQPAANSSSYNDTAVVCGTSYQYRIRAYRSGDNQFSAYSNVVTGTSSLCPSPTPPPASGIKDITFEHGSLSHASTGADSVVGTVLLESSNPLKGLYSARIAPLGESPYLQESFSATNDFYLSFYIKIDSYPTADLRLVLISNAGTTLGNIQLRPSGRLRLRNNSTTIGAESAPLALGQLYRIGIQQSKGTGSNAVLRAWLSSNDTAFGSPFAQLTNGTWTSAADRLRLGATTPGTFNIVLDDIRLDPTAMPAASNPPNAAPTISDVTDKSLSMNASSSAIAFTVGDAETAAASLQVTASSSNTSLVPNANIILGGSGANRTVTISPASNQAGTATITLTVSDGSSTTSDTFILTVTNTAPTISNVSDQSINANSATSALAFTVGDAETAAASLVMSASSSNTSLVPVANIVFGGSGTNRTVSVTPASNQAGSATITLTVSDGDAQSSDSFVLTVTAPPNTAPTISDVTDQTINANSATSALAFTIGDAETAAANLVLSAVSSNTALVPVANIVFGGSGTNRTVTVTPAANQVGSSTIILTVSDPYASTSDSFVLTVTTPPNTPPTISNVTDNSISMNAATSALAFTIGDAETAAANLILSAVSSNTALVPVANIVFGGSGTNRTVTITPASNQAGSATIGITVSDGFADTMDTFILTVTNTAPSISDVLDQSITANSTTAALAFTVGDAETAAANLVMSASSSNTSLVPNANIVFGGSGASRTVTVTAASNQTGSASISLTVSDGLAQSSDSFVLTVNPGTGTTVLNVTPSDDAYVRSDNVNSNYGSLDHLRLRGTAAFYNSYLKFNLSNINGTVTSARLRLYAYDGTNDPNSVYLVSNNYLSTSTPWTQLGLKWNNAPTIGGTPITTRTASIANNTWVEYDVSSAITANGTYSFGLSSSSGTNSLYFNSLEAASGKPVLEVTFSNSGSNTAPTISDVADQTITANSATAALPFTLGDAETPAANLQLSVSSSNTSLVPNANLSLGGSGANRSITVTPVINQTGTTTITMTVSDGVLTASDSFVVTVTIGGGTTSLSFSPTEDAYVRSDNANSNYGSADHLRMRGTEAYYTSYLKFNVTGLTGTVTSARLRLYAYDGTNDPNSVYLVSNNYLGTSTPWLETGLNWNNAPQMSGSPVLTRATAIANNTWVEYDLTPVITGNGTYSFGLSIVGTNSLYFYSDEATSNRPVLEITVNEGGTSSSATLFTRPEASSDANLILPQPTALPTEILAPTELVPSETPVVEIPTVEPTAIPSEAILVPTELPTEAPTEAPALPSEAPVEEATGSP